MGVHGWNKLLVHVGVLPDPQQAPRSVTAEQGCPSCSATPWTPTEDEEAAERIGGARASVPRGVGERCFLPEGSTLHIDGNGLAFYLHRAAYARYGAQQPMPSRGQRRPHPSTWTPELLPALIPTWMPLSVLAQVTAEFLYACRGLKKVIFYWDGDARRLFKSDTDQQRQERQDTEWAQLGDWCQVGRWPIQQQSHQQNCWICASHDTFPKPRLFTLQVYHTILQLQQWAQEDPDLAAASAPPLEIVVGDEEADALLARAARGRPDHYALGQDSDYCFFPDVNYLPLNSLRFHPNDDDPTACPQLSAALLRRDGLAHIFQFPDEEFLVELAMCMGNDYVDPPTHLPRVDGMPPASSKALSVSALDELLDFWREQAPGYRLPAADSEESRQVLRFVRALYQLEDLDEYPLIIKDEKEEEEEEENGWMDEHDRLLGRPRLPSTVQLELATLQPSDSSVKEAAVRFVWAHIVPETQPLARWIQPLHVEVFTSMVVQPYPPTLAAPSPWAGLPRNWRPPVADVVAAALLEQVVAASMKQSVSQPVVKKFPPYLLLDLYQFYILMYQARHPAPLSLPPTAPLPAAARTPNPTTSSSATTTANPSASSSTPAAVVRDRLPIDEHQETILGAIERNRVTIIQGETGCGKSSRIPVMILRAPPPDPATDQVRLFISQPRRIAAKALVERVRSVEPDLADVVALRMGHGVREYETKSTRAWFVTTGYLVRLLANHPEKFDRISHLVIDEVHERSVDTDILCLLCRRLLQSNSRIRLILMSATLAASMYQEYFQVPDPPIFVGARRFPVEEVFLEDISRRLPNLPAKEAKMVQALLKECRELKCKRAPSTNYMEKLYSVVACLATLVGSPGSSVLIFVPGMNDIIAITELVEQLFVPGVRFTCFPIHSDIPFEDQMDVFKPSGADEIKVVVATNAAESSVTLPDVDHVVCLGLCKQIFYNEGSHRQILQNTWISRASSTQRKGRTGRLRPGTVYRMYTKENFEVHMDEFEPGEMLRIPLDSVILMLKEMLAEKHVTSVLLDCIEPPKTDNIERSLQSLFRSNFITSPEEDSDITSLGKFVSALGIDLALGSLIGLGIQFGVGPEAIQMASVLSFPKTPWVMSNPLIHDAKDYNEKTALTFVSRCHFDANLHSEPLATMNMLWDYRKVKDKDKSSWCWRFGVFQPRIRRLDGSCNNLRRRVADFFGIDDKVLEPTHPPFKMPNSKVTILRILNVWVFHELVIQCKPSAAGKGLKDGFKLQLGRGSAQVNETELKQILSSERHKFALQGYSESTQKGSFEVFLCPEELVSELEQHILSYAIVKSVPYVWVNNGDQLTVYGQAANSDPTLLQDLLLQLDATVVTSRMMAQEVSGVKKRGRGERTCGRWSLLLNESNAGIDDDRLWYKFKFRSYSGSKSKKKLKEVDFQLSQLVRKESRSGLSCKISFAQGTQSAEFTIVCRGNLDFVAQQDLNDLFSSPAVTERTRKRFSDQQAIFFPKSASMPLVSNGESLKGTSWERPIVDSHSEGARLLSVMASGRRREHVIKLSSSEKGDEEIEGKDLFLDKAQSCVQQKWKLFNGRGDVFLESNSVPASILPVSGTDIIYCCCANALELKGGAMKVEGLTLLPPGRIFLLLSRLTFGLFDVANAKDGSLVEKSMLWLGEGGSSCESDWSRRIEMAVTFDQSAISLGETLECFPTMVRRLLEVFDGVDGYESKPWNDLDSNPFVPEVIEKLRRNQKTCRNGVTSFVSPDDEMGMDLFDRKLTCAKDEDDYSSDDGSLAQAQLILAATSHLEEEKPSKNGRNRKNGTTKIKGFKNGEKAEAIHQIRSSGLMVSGHARQVDSNTNEVRHLFKNLFATDLGAENDEVHALPSTNILALVVQQVRLRNGIVMEKSLIGAEDWDLLSVVCDGGTYFVAKFKNSGLVYTRQANNSKIRPWIKQTHPILPRPNCVDDAIDCVPSDLALETGRMEKTIINGNQTIAFANIEMAFRMEAAFYLERQFRSVKGHWFELDISRMVGRLDSELKNVRRKKK